MTKETIKQMIGAEPFKPFSLRLRDGSLVPVPRPEFILVTQGGRTAYVNVEGERVKILDLTLITAIEVGQGASGG